MLETIGSQLICWLSTKELSWTTLLSWKYRKNPITTTWFKILEPTCNTSSIMLHFDWLISTPISAIVIWRKGPWPAGKKAHSGRRVVSPPSCRICQIDSISNHNQLHLKVVSMCVYIYVYLFIHSKNRGNLSRKVLCTKDVIYPCTPLIEYFEILSISTYIASNVQCFKIQQALLGAIGLWFHWGAWAELPAPEQKASKQPFQVIKCWGVLMFFSDT